MVTHLLAIAGEKYGNIPVGKGEDDSIKFVNLLKESRMPSESRTVKWDTVKEIVEKYQVSSSLHSLWNSRCAEQRDDSSSHFVTECVSSGFASSLRIYLRTGSHDGYLPACARRRTTTIAVRSRKRILHGSQGTVKN